MVAYRAHYSIILEALSLVALAPVSSCMKLGLSGLITIMVFSTCKWLRPPSNIDECNMSNHFKCSHSRGILIQWMLHEPEKLGAPVHVAFWFTICCTRLRGQTNNSQNTSIQYYRCNHLTCRILPTLFSWLGNTESSKNEQCMISMT